MTQCNAILNHLKTFGAITTLEAIEKYHILRPAARVSDLRQRGIDIRTINMEHVNSYGEHTRYAKYVLHEGDN